MVALFPDPVHTQERETSLSAMVSGYCLLYSVHGVDG